MFERTPDAAERTEERRDQLRAVLHQIRGGAEAVNDEQIREVEEQLTELPTRKAGEVSVPPGRATPAP